MIEIKKEDSKIYQELENNIKESFCFLSVGMWLQGEPGHDRKNISGLVKVFLETFKNKKQKPALILKTSCGSPSIIDRDEVLKRIDKIRDTVNSKDLPNIYLFHGDITDREMNELYNHPKIKAMVSLTFGEGFGKPLLEFTQSKKPVICSGWSGPVDFLNKDFATLLPGTLTPIHPSAQVADMLIEGSRWYSVDLGLSGGYLRDYYENYKKYESNGKRLAHYTKTNFSYEAMKIKMKIILDREVRLPYSIKLPPLLRKV